MKLIFAGTPPFAAEALTALHKAGHEIVLVLSQPDRPAGRGLKLTPSAVAAEAVRLGLRLDTPATLKDADVQAKLRLLGADVMVVAAYGLLLPQAVLDIPAKGCINIHGSLLPRWRGAAPVQRAIEAGDRETGISIMQMEAGLDTGPVLMEKKLAIADDEISATLFKKLTTLGASAIVEALRILPELMPRTQGSESTYARKIEKSEARIDWSQPASVIERRLRAFDPFPGCETQVNGETVKIWRADVLDVNAANTPPGTIIDAGPETITVQCGQQQLRWKVVQKSGGKRMMIDQFLRGNALSKGTTL